MPTSSVACAAVAMGWWETGEENEASGESYIMLCIPACAYVIYKSLWVERGEKVRRRRRKEG